MKISNIDLDNIIERFNDPEGKIALGIDGYIDSVWHIIASKDSNDDYVFYNKMRNFSQTLMACEDGGFANEIISKRRAFGGFTAHTAEAIVGLGVETSMLGMFGKEAIDPAFNIFSGVKEIVSIGDPALAVIYEFNDGKLMLLHVEELMSLTWKRLTDTVGEPLLKEFYSNADIIGLGYWSLMPAFDDIVSKICEYVKDNKKTKRLFLDFADIRKRDKSALDQSLAHLKNLNNQLPITLSLNENEGELMFSYFGETFVMNKEEGSVAQTEKVREAIGLDELVVHTPYFAVASSATEGSCSMTQNHCSSPLITAGAGDNFSGGYLAASLKGLPLAERLFVANAVTYLYVSRGKSPTREEFFEEITLQATR